MSERITTVNLHTHTHRCKHARGIPADYAKAAEEKGIRVLGMTDHTPFPDDRVIMIRMGIAELDDYYDYDAKRQMLIGMTTGYILKLGGQVRIRVDRVDVERGEINFELIGFADA